MNATIFYPTCAEAVENGSMFHIMFPFELKEEFEKWCKKNRIGYEEGCREDVVKSDCHVFTKTENREIFKPEQKLNQT